VTDITEDPATGTICVVGFQMPVIPPQSQIQDADITPRFATIRFGDAGPVEAVCPIDASTTNDMALPLCVICTDGTIQSHNEAQ